MKKIALFGGTFDPIHTDHINIIKACKKDLGFDEVWLIPTWLNPFKNFVSSSIEDRVKMLEIAIKNLDYVFINDYEIKIKKKSYTYNTIVAMQKKYKNYHFEFILGSDQVAKIEMWYKFNELLKIIKFNIFIRDDSFDKKIIKKYNFSTFNFDNNNLSSTKIRNLIDIKLQIPEVNNYINDNLIYMYDRLEKNMDQERYFHSLNTGKMAKVLAQINNEDEDSAYRAGVLHDVAKRFDSEKLKEYILKYDKTLLDEPEPVLHSYVGAFHLKNDWLIKDEKIISAVFKHTAGSINMTKFERIIFCADKISDERKYYGVEKLREITLNNLDEGFKLILKNQYENAIKKNGIEKIGKGLIETYNYYVLGEKNNEN